MPDAPLMPTIKRLGSEAVSETFTAFELERFFFNVALVFVMLLRELKGGEDSLAKDQRLVLIRA